MNIIFLSGGSGKRLWPLSNDTRSKQFLKLLSDDKSNYESMVQRVFRQLNESNIKPKNVVVSTSKSQIDSIKKHLGDDVEIVFEPERRNTFPAIVLSSAYLYFEKKCSLDDVVVVLPVDSFIESTYFQTLLKMEKVVLSGEADIVLMGIQPTYPSEKYGYIIPKSPLETEVIVVEKFIEKPSTNEAKSFIKEGALWNGGVFAFKLKYIIDIMNQNMEVGSYPDVYNNYHKLNKNSFDYEVIENASSISLVPYNGIWEDLGTWNTLVEEMPSESIGKSIIGEGTQNTHVINELDIPIVVLGMKNTVVVASPDGILVSGKPESSSIKQYVEKLDQRPMYEERQWGEYKVIDYKKFSRKHTLTKHMYIKSGQNISYQKHNMRDEIWTFIDGTGELLIDGHIHTVHVGDIAYIAAGQKHSLKAIGDLHFIEVQIGEELVEEDIERFEWNWQD